eukprot:2126527-Rhodomonas_salina.1
MTGLRQGFSELLPGQFLTWVGSFGVVWWIAAGQAMVSYRASTEGSRNGNHLALELCQAPEPPNTP